MLPLRLWSRCLVEATSPSLSFGYPGHFQNAAGTPRLRERLCRSAPAKARFDFSPYGELMRSAGLPLTVGYTGHRWDPAIGQYFAPFRYYNPQTARWNMRDPLGFLDGLNKYSYVRNNPIIRSDELGLKGTQKECDDLWNKVVRSRRKLKEAQDELEYYTKTHPEEQKLPEFHPCQDTQPGKSVEGHRRTIEKYKRALEKNKDNFNNNCRDPKDGSYLYPFSVVTSSPVVVPGPPNSSLERGCPADMPGMTWVFQMP